MWFLSPGWPDARLSTRKNLRKSLFVSSVILAGAPLACLSQQPSGVAPAAVQEIQVTAKHLIVKNEIDRKVYSLDETAKALNNSLSDLLNNIPSVDVDSEGVVSLRGSTDVTILVNGKPAPELSGAAAAQNILTMSSSSIQSIEILTVPPAQFAARGAAGIINIVTKADLSDPLSGSVQASVGDDGRAFAGANVNYHAGALSLTLNAQDRHDVRERVIRSDLVAPDSVAGNAIVNSSSSTNEKILQSTPSVGADAKYVLNDFDSLELSVNAVDWRNHRYYTQVNSGVELTDLLVSDSSGNSTRHDRGIDINEALGWNHKFERPAEELEISLTQWTGSPVGSYDNTVATLLPPSGVQITQVAERESYSDTEGDIDYTLPLSRGQTLKIGFSGENWTYHNGNIGSDIDPESGGSTPDPLLTNQFSFDQNVDAAYASYEIKNSAGSWDGLFGIRGESAWTRGDDITDSIVTATTRNSLFPNLHLMHVVSSAVTLSLAAGRRISRPDADSQNPYVFREYSPNLSAGNPLLLPAITTSYEFGCNVTDHDASYGVTAYHRDTSDARTIVVSTLDDGTTLTTPANFDHIESSGLEFSADGSLGQKLSYSASGNLFYSQVPPQIAGSGSVRTTTGLNGKLKLTYRRVAGESIQVVYIRRDKFLTSQGYVAPTNIVNAGLQHRFSHGWAMVATISDISDDQYFQRSLAIPTFTQQYSRYTRGQVIFVGAIYTFGESSKSRELEYEKPDIETSVH
jgi:outer membrane receptor for ferrienterochelin and colicin